MARSQRDSSRGPRRRFLRWLSSPRRGRRRTLRCTTAAGCRRSTAQSAGITSRPPSRAASTSGRRSIPKPGASFTRGAEVPIFREGAGIVWHCYVVIRHVSVVVAHGAKAVRHVIRHRSGHRISHRAARTILRATLVCVPLGGAVGLILPPVIGRLGHAASTAPNGMTPVPIPEPSTLWLLAAAVAGLAVIRHR